MVHTMEKLIVLLKSLESDIARSHGGTDMKVTSSKLAAKLQFIAQSGPTWDPLPPFRWSEQGWWRWREGTADYK